MNQYKTTFQELEEKAERLLEERRLKRHGKTGCRRNTKRPRRLTEQEWRDKLYARTVRTNTGCIVWTGPTYVDGYGKIGFAAERKTHRLSMILSGVRIPHGLSVLHRCDNPPCINPEHLCIGTQQDNIRDMVTKGRAGLNSLKSIL